MWGSFHRPLKFNNWTVLSSHHQAKPRHAIPYHPHNTTPYHTRQYHAVPRHTIPYHTIPYLTIPYLTLPYHTIPYHTIAIPYHTIPQHTRFCQPTQATLPPLYPVFPLYWNAKQRARHQNWSKSGIFLGAVSPRTSARTISWRSLRVSIKLPLLPFSLFFFMHCLFYRIRSLQDQVDGFLSANNCISSRALPPNIKCCNKEKIFECSEIALMRKRPDVSCKLLPEHASFLFVSGKMERMLLPYHASFLFVRGKMERMVWTL